MENQEPLSAEGLVKMAAAMRHRGPDGEGFALSGAYSDSHFQAIRGLRPESLLETFAAERTICLAHRRLSILDLSAQAAQPMRDEAGKTWVVFNGEIYNHLEIRKELQQLGLRFRTDHSDTETLLLAYKTWGRACVHKLRGMFAFAIWDSAQDLLWLCRDRIGIKPLYYTLANGRFYFASEIKAILEDVSIPRKLNEKGLYDYLSFLIVPAPNTLFEGIYKLPAGHELVFQHGKMIASLAYWDVFDNVKIRNEASEKQLAAELSEQLSDAVRSHLLSDVPMGVFLSGGIDSSTNVALFSKERPGAVKAFSIGYADDHKLESYSNEFAYAREIAELFGCDYHEKALTPKDLLDFLPLMPYHQDEPIADPVCFPVYEVSKLAREHGVVVAQVGEGSDELFHGYGTWRERLNFQAKAGGLPRFGARLGGLAFKALRRETGPKREWLRRLEARQPIFWGGAEAFYETEKNMLLSDRMRRKFKHYTSWESIRRHYDKFLRSAPEPTTADWMTYIDLKLRLPELLLMRVDKMSMICSLEGRVPFLDHQFVEFAMSIPSPMRADGKNLKKMLKLAVRGIIPDSVIDRKKQGFGVPIIDWFNEHLARKAQHDILEFNEATQVFDNTYLDKLFHDNSHAVSNKLWYLLNLALWWKAYIFEFQQAQSS